MLPQALTLTNPQNGNLAFKIFSFEDNASFDHVQRLNYYSIILLRKGQGTLKADFSDYTLPSPSIMCFSPFQPFMIETGQPIRGVAVNFHPDFFCIHKHEKEVSCNGVLFNNIYKPPLMDLDEKDAAALWEITEQMRVEMTNKSIAQYDILVAYLKIFLIQATRLKLEKNLHVKEAAPSKTPMNREPITVQQLHDAIEKHYDKLHSPSDYAGLLNISLKGLGKVVKKYFNKTLTEVIAQRIIIEAKRELYLSSKPIKAIAFQLGFEDEYYFSRFFKTHTDISPQFYRNTVGFAAAERA